MARNIRKSSRTKTRYCDASCIGNKRGMAHRAKTKSNKMDRQELSADMRSRAEEIKH